MHCAVALDHEFLRKILNIVGDAKLLEVSFIFLNQPDASSIKFLSSLTSASPPGFPSSLLNFGADQDSDLLMCIHA